MADGVPVPRSVSIVIVNYRTRELLRDCLQSVHRHGSTGLEMIVVDNDSRDGSAEMVRDEFPEVRLIQNSENVGFAAANNQGMKEAHGKYILLLNSDTVVQPGAIGAMSTSWMLMRTQVAPDAGFCLPMEGFRLPRIGMRHLESGGSHFGFRDSRD
jgi:GT2 family glycosyltransferase